jgi:hypothetical protein
MNSALFFSLLTIILFDSPLLIIVLLIHSLTVLVSWPQKISMTTKIITRTVLGQGNAGIACSNLLQGTDIRVRCSFWQLFYPSFSPLNFRHCHGLLTGGKETLQYRNPGKKNFIFQDSEKSENPEGIIFIYICLG